MRIAPLMIAIAVLSVFPCLAQDASPQSRSADELPPYDTAIDSLVKNLLGDLPEDVARKHTRMAVGFFVCGDGAGGKTKYTGKFGELLASDVKARLFKARKFQLVTREDLDKLLEESDFWVSDMVSGATIPKKERKFSAFTLLVRGKYFADLKTDKVKVTAELVEIQTAEPRSLATVLLRRGTAVVTLDAKELGLGRKLAANLAETASAVAETTPEPVRVRVWAEGMKKVFRKGEKIRFKVKADRDAYIRLFDHRPDGKTVMIFPNAYHRDAFVKAGQVVSLPSESMGFDFTVEAPFGPEAVQAVATTSRVASEKFRTRGGLDAPENKNDPFLVVEGGMKTIADVIRETHKEMIKESEQPDKKPGVQTRGAGGDEGGQRGIGVRKNEPIPAWAEDHWTFVTKHGDVGTEHQ